ncbi:MAG: hypothetical protein ACUVX1_00220 [Chloroflexota bacterium]
MDWNLVLSFARGPLYDASVAVLVVGMAYRLIRVMALGWKLDRAPVKGSRVSGVAISYAKGAIVWPFIPWLQNTFSRNPVIYLAGGLFHLGLFVTVFFSASHVQEWSKSLRFGWPPLPAPIVDWFAATAILAIIVLAINRKVNPILKMLTGPGEMLNLLMVFLPMITGYVHAHQLWFGYEMSFSLHMLAVCALHVYIPFSRISHCVFYFLSRAIHGWEYGKRAVQP